MSLLVNMVYELVICDMDFSIWNYPCEDSAWYVDNQVFVPQFYQFYPFILFMHFAVYLCYILYFSVFLMNIAVFWDCIPHFSFVTCTFFSSRLMLYVLLYVMFFSIDKIS